jgi:PAS domain S-box-containing protein
MNVYYYCSIFRKIGCVKSNPRNKKYIPPPEIYSQIVDSLQDYSIFTMNNRLLINSWSNGSSAIFGYEAEEIMGQHFRFVFTEEDVNSGIPEKEIRIAKKEGRAIDNRWHLKKDGSTFYASGLVFPLKNPQGKQTGYVKILRDLTERRNAQTAINKYVKDLEELSNHKDTILAILSHDLRSPLGAILGITDFLGTHYDKISPDERKEILANLHKAAVQELEMLDQLLKWACIKSTAEVFDSKRINLFKKVNKVFEILSETADVESIKLINSVNKNTFINTDQKVLLSILLNLVSNAIKFSNKGGIVAVKANYQEEQLVISVKDSGPGMSDEKKEKLFTPQIHALSNEKHDARGAGIGLFLIKNLLEKYNGKLWVESQVGVGSTFYFTLPEA